ncbi:NAD(P)-dependent oxidoreductase [Pendulispora brunnea]|uniref:dTDP-4-dehydrorhamnose reductase n=1 Tax=Pendulispora brunnea TaxID=2905690 RepID=A0ABZ2K4Q8_9BACT
MQRLLVVGASGLVGAELVRRARGRDLEVVGAARTVASEATVALDLGDRAAVRRVLEETEPDVVILASAWPHVDGCESDPQRSQRENIETYRNVVEASAGSTRLVFYSTDHVFDGEKDGPYTEDDRPNPLNVYSRHKLEAEQLILGHGRALVVRTGWVFGQELRRKNFVYRVIDVARRGEVLKVPPRQAGCPTFSGWLSDATLTLLGQGTEGVVHLTGGEPHTKAQWAETIARSLGLELRIEEVDAAASGQVAPRPERVVLASARHTLAQPPVKGILRAERQRLLC